MSEVTNAQKNAESKDQQSQESKEMKRSTRIVLLILSILFFLGAIITPIIIFATPSKGNNYVESTKGDFILRFDPAANVYDIVRYIGDSDEVTVPAEVDGIPVRDILPDAFNAEIRSSNRNIKSVEIEDGIRSVGKNAFKGCESLTDMNLPASVESVGERAFEGSGVKDVTIQDASKLKFEQDALAGAENLSKLTIEGASEDLNKDSLGNLSDNITDLEIGKNVNVGQGALDGLDNITTLYVYNYSNLVVDKEAFVNNNITTLNIYFAEENLTEDFMQKFIDLNKLQTVNIAKGIKNLKPNALSPFEKLNTVTIENGANIDISSLPLVSTSQLKVKLVPENEGDGLKLNITHDSNNSSFNVIGESFTNFFEAGKVTELTLSENFTDIGENAFAAYTSLSRLDFGKNSKIRIIGSNAFGGENDVVNIRVYGPEKGEKEENYVFGLFNRSSGRYHKRLSYNDMVELGSYYINLNYNENYGETSPKDPVPARFPHRIDVLVGDVISSYLPVQTGEQDKIVEGYTLLGWGTSRDKIDVEFTSSVMQASYNDRTLYAIWMPGNNVRYTIKYYVQSLGEPTQYEDYGDPFETENDGTNHLTRYGITGTIVGGEDLKVKIRGFKFVETAKNGRQSKVSDTLSPNGDTELWLYYDREQYDIEFDFNDTADSVTKVDPNNVNWDGVETADRGDKKVSLVMFGSTYGTLPTVTRDGYDFLYWYTNIDGEVEVKEGDNFVYDHNITLYAKWQKKESGVTYSLQYYMQNADIDSQYDLDEGRSNSAVTGRLADDEVELSPAEIVGFTFDHATYTASYQTEEQDVDDLKVRICGDNSTVIKLYYIRKTYTINYDLNDSTGTTRAHVVEPSSLSSITLRYGQKYVLPQVARDGYTLKGWNLSSDETGTWITSSLLVPSGDVSGENAQTLYAIWKNNTYKVHYEANKEGARNTTEDSFHVFDISSALNANNFDVDGYHFAGWCEKKVPEMSDKIYTNLEEVTNLTTEAYNAGDETKGVVTLYATWDPNTYDVVYHANNELATESTATSHMTYGEKQHLTNNGFKLTGYHFTGWVRDPETEVSSQKLYTDGEEVSNLTTENNAVVDMYAVWEANEYTVSFDGGEGATGSITSITAKYDQHKNLPKNDPDNGEGFKKAGYTFVGWSKSEQGGKEIEDEGDIYNLTPDQDGEVTLYAVWEAIKYTITLYYNDNTESSEQLSDVTLDGYSLPRTHEYKGYSIKGFSETKGEVGGEINAQLSADITEWLKAKIEKNETSNLKVYIIWDANEGTQYSIEYYLEELNIDENYSRYYKETATGKTTKTAKTESSVSCTAEELIQLIGEDTFKGFTFDETKTGGQNSGTVKGDGSTTLKLYFKRETYQVTFNLNKAEGTTGTISKESVEPIQVVYGAPYIVNGSFEQLTRGGYTFNGWSTTQDRDNIIDAATLYTLTTGSELYAIWTKATASYKVEYYLQNLGTTSKDVLGAEDFTLSPEHSENGKTSTTDESLTITSKEITGFTYDESLLDSTSLTQVIDGDGKTVFKLYYKRNKVTITFSANGTQTEKSCEFGQELNLSDESLIENPVKNGYTFLYWSKQSDMEHSRVNNYVVTENPETFEAQFSENSYTIKIDENMTDTIHRAFGFTYAFEGGQVVKKYTESVNLYEEGESLTRTGYTLVGFDFIKSQIASSVVYKMTDLSEEQEVTISDMLGHAECGVPAPYVDGATITLYAIWAKNSYSVNYKDNGQNISDGEHAYGSSFTTKDSTTFTKEGYYFTEWVREGHEEEKYKVNSQIDMPDHDLVLTPDWKQDTFTISYHKNEGSASTAPATGDEIATATFTYDAESEQIASNSWQLRGYTFSHWYTKASGADGVKYDAGQTLNKGEVNTLYKLSLDSSKHIDLYAIWTANKYNLRVYDYFNGEAEEYKDVELTFDKRYNLQNSGSIQFTHEGYEFLGWHTSAEQTDEVAYKVSANPFILNAKDGVKELNAENKEANTYTIYAMWKASEQTHYVVHHHRQELDGSYANEGNLYEKEDGYGATDTQATANVREYPGFHQDTTGDHNDHLSGNIDGNGSLELHVYYARNIYSIEFNRNEAGKSGTISALNDGNLDDILKTKENIMFGAVIGKLPTSAEFKKNGYEFLGWFVSPTEGDEPLNEGSTFTYDYIENGGTLTLYAHWNATESHYKVEYFYQDLTGEGYTQNTGKTFNGTGLTDTSISLEEITSKGLEDGFIRDHYVPTPLNLINGDEKENNIQIYFRRLTYNLTLERQDGISEFYAKVNNEDRKSTGRSYTYTISDVRFGSNIELVYTLAKGYTFAGFYAGESVQETPFTMPNKALTIEARANANVYNIEYNANGGKEEAVTEESKSYIDTFVTKPASTFTRDGYKLVGWSLSEGVNSKEFDLDHQYNVKDIVTDETISSDKITLYAVWEAIHFTFVYHTKTEDEVQGEMANDVFTYDDESKKNLTKVEDNLTKVGYTFKEWVVGTAEEIGVGETFADEQDVYNKYTTETTIHLWATWTAKEYSVSYETKGGSPKPANSTFTYDGEENYITSEVVTKTGYKFLGWSLVDGATSATWTTGAKVEDNTISPNGEDVILYAVYEAHKYEVVYNKGNAKEPAKVTGEMTNSTYTYDKPVVLRMNAYEYPGYEFLGWAKTLEKAQQKEIDYSNGDTIRNNELYEKDPESEKGKTITLYAVWDTEKTEYYVEYYKENEAGDGTYGTYADRDTLREDTDSEVTVQPNPTKYPGFELDTEKNTMLSGKVTAGEKKLTIKVYYKRITYNVTFDRNVTAEEITGNIDENPEQKQVKFGGSMSEVAGTAFNRTGYQFDGWYYDQEFDRKVEAGDTYTETHDITVYAKFTATNTSKYKVEYWKEGFTEGSEEHVLGEDREVTEVLTDSSVKVDPEAEKFEGFDAPSSITLKVRADGTTVFKFVYTRKEFDLTLQKGEGVETFTAGSCIDGYEITPSRENPNVYKVKFEAKIKLSNTIHDGYTFEKYSFVDGVEASESYDSEFTIKGALTIKATATANTYTITYAPGTGAEGSIEGTSVKYNTEVILSDGEGFTKTGYNFVGWAFKDNQNDKVYAGKASVQGSKLLLDAIANGVATDYNNQEITLYAVWSIGSFTVTYEAGEDGSGKTITETYEYNSTQSYKANNVFTRNGYHYDNWIEKGEIPGEDRPVNGEFQVEARNITLVPKWEANKYNVTFHANYDGAEPESSVVEFTYDGESNNMAAALTRNGYTFLGWSKEKAAREQTWTGGQQNVGNAVSANGMAVDVYAVWRVNVYTIHYNAGEKGVGDQKTASVTYEATHEFLDESGFSRTGYHFLGWAFTSGAAEAKYTALSSIKGSALASDYAEFNEEYTAPYEDTTIELYAVWEADTNVKYTIEYFLQNETKDGFEAEAETSEERTDGTADATKELDIEKTFKGFIIKDEDKHKSFTVEADGSTKVRVEYYRLAINITFDGNDPDPDNENHLTGGPTASNPYIYKDADTNLPAHNYTFDHEAGAYEFAGWSLTKDNQGEVQFNDESSVNAVILEACKDADGILEGTKSVTLFAVWSKGQVKVTIEVYTQKFDENNVKPLSSGEGVALESDFTKSSSSTILVTTGESIDLSDTYTTYVPVGYKYDETKISEDMRNLKIESVVGDSSNVIKLYLVPKSYTAQFGPGVTDEQRLSGDKPEDIEVYFGASIKNTFAAVECSWTYKGHKFESWIFEGIKAAQSSATIASYDDQSNHSVTASWIANKFTVNYQTGVEEGDPDKVVTAGGKQTSVSTNYDASITLPTAVSLFTRVGFTLVGFTYGEGNELTSLGQSVKINEIADKLSIADTDGSVINLTAKWQESEYVIKVDPQGGTFTFTDQVSSDDTTSVVTLGTFKYTQAIKLSTYISNITKTGYTFTGFTFNDNTYQLNDEQQLVRLSVGGEITLLATWQIHSSYTLEVQVKGKEEKDDIANATAYIGEDKETSSKSSLKFNDEVTVNVEVKEGYHFLGWFTDAALTEEAVYEQAEYTFNMPGLESDTSTYTLYAGIARDTYTINYSVETYLKGVKSETLVGGSIDHTDGVNPTSVRFGDEITLKVTINPGYHFDGNDNGWFLNGSRIVATENKLKIEAQEGGDNAEISLVAKFSANEYKVKFDKVAPEAVINYAKQEPADGFSIFYSESHNISEFVTSVTRKGYVFTYFTIDGDGSSTHYTLGSSFENLTEEYSAGALTTITFKANYSANAISITFDKNFDGALGEIEGITLTYGEEGKLIPDSGFTREGYDLAGWATSNKGAKIEGLFGQTLTAEQFANLAEIDDQSQAVTLYAVWEAKTYSFDVEVYTQVGNSKTKDSAGGEVTFDKAIKYDGTVSMTAKAHGGYSFVGFYRDSIFAEGSLISKSLTAPSDAATSSNLLEKEDATNGKCLTQYALFKANEYKLTIHTSPAELEDLEFTLDSEDYGDIAFDRATGTYYINLPTSVSVTITASDAQDYLFEGWYTGNATTSSAGEGKALTTSAMTSAGLEYTIKYTPRTYKLQFKFLATIDSKAQNAQTEPKDITTGETIKLDEEFSDNFIATLQGLKLTLTGWKLTEGGASADYDTTAQLPVTELADAASVRGKNEQTIVLYAVFATEKVTATIKAEPADGGNAYITRIGSSSLGSLTSYEADLYTINTAANTATSNVLTLTAQAKTGYKITGWSDNVTAAAQSSTTATATLKTEGNDFVVNFAKKEFNFSFEVATFRADSVTKDGTNVGGTISPTEGSKYAYQAPIALTATPNAGYSFVGWFTDATCKTSANVQSQEDRGVYSGSYTVPNVGNDGATRTLYAKFVANKYKITFDGNNPTEEELVWTAISGFTEEGGNYYKEFEFNQKLGTLPQVSAKGYSFVGWFTDKTVGETQITDQTISEVDNNDTTYYARYVQSTFDVSLRNFYTSKSSDQTSVTEGNIGGSATITSANETEIGSATGSIQVGNTVTITAKANAGYKFVGWFEDETCKTLSTLVGDDDNTKETATFVMPNNEVELFAKFEIQQFNVKLTPRAVLATSATETGALGAATEDVYELTGAGDYDYKASVTITAKAKTGYTFVGWFNSETCETPYFEDTATQHLATKSFTMGAKNVEIFAKFTINSYDVKTIVYTRDTASSAATTTANGNAFTIDAVIGGGKAVTSGKIYYNQKAAFTLTIATGYSLTGFYSGYSSGSFSGDLTLEGEENNRTYTITKATTIYVLFTRNSFDVTAEARVRTASSVNAPAALSGVASDVGGTVSLSNAQADSTKSVKSSVNYNGSFTAYAFAKAGYTFVGWYLSTASNTDSDKAVQTTTTLSVKSLTKGCTYYAIFIANIVNVSVSMGYKNNDNMAVSASKAGTGTGVCAINEVPVAYSMPNKGTSGYFVGKNLELSVKTKGTGYHFLGWYSYVDNVLGGQLESEETYTHAVTEATSIIAVFERDSFNVTITAKYTPANATHGLGDIANVPTNSVSTIGGVGAAATANSASYSVKVFYGDTLTTYALARGNYEFAGWFEDAECETNWGSAAAAVKTSPLTTSALTATDEIYAKFSPAETTYNAYVRGQNSTNANTLGNLTDGIGGKITSTTSGSIYKGQSVSFTAAANEGFTFLGWYTTADCTTKFSASTSSANYSVSGTTSLTITFSNVLGEVKVYARFAPILYNNVQVGVKYINNGGSTLADAKAGSGTTNASAKIDTKTTSYQDYTGATKTGYYLGNISVTATAGTGYTFKGWFDDITSSSWINSPDSEDKTWTELAVKTTAQTFYAVFERNKFTVTVETKYATSADITSYTSGITGGKVNEQTSATYTKDVYYGDSITLTAVSETGYGFSGYYSGSEVKNSGATYTFTVTEAVNLEARFTYSSYNVTINNKYITADSKGAIAKGGDDSIVQSGATGGSLAGKTGVFYGSAFTGTATITDGYYLKGIYKDASCLTLLENSKVDGASVTISNITGNVTGYALFVLKTYNITLTARKETAKDNSNLNTTLSNGGGTLGVTTTKVSDSAYGISGYFVGTDVTLNCKTTDAGYKFDGWYPNDATCKTGKLEGNIYNASKTSTQNGATITIYGAFRLQKYQVTATGFYKSANGTHSLESTLNALTETQGSVGGSGKYYYGTSVTLTATPTSTWQMPKWYSNANCSTESTATISSVSNNEDNNIRYALFIPKEYTITLQGATRTAASVNTLGNRTLGALSQLSTNAGTANKVYHGQTVTLTATDRSGYTFVGWYTGTTTTSDGTKANAGKTYTTGAITSNQTYYGMYITTPQTISVTAYFQAAGTTANALANPAKGTTGGSVKISTTAFSEYGQTGYFFGTGYSVSLSATAETSKGYEFKGWFTDVPTASGTATNTGATYAAPFTSSSSPKAYYGLFALKSYTITATASYRSAKDATTYNAATTGTTGGTVSGTATLRYGQSATLTASANTTGGYVFIGWYDGLGDTATQIATTTELSRTCTKTETIYARFILKKIKVDVSAHRYAPTDAVTLSSTLSAGGGTVTIAKVLTSATNGDSGDNIKTGTSATTGYILYGTAPSLSQSHAAEYEFTKWQKSDGSAYSSGTNLTADTSIWAVFTCTGKYTLTINNYYRNTTSTTAYDTTTFTEGTVRGKASVKNSYTFFKGFDILAGSNKFFTISPDGTGEFEGFYKAENQAVSSKLTSIKYEELTSGTIYAVFIPKRFAVSLNSVSQTATNATTLGSATTAATGTATATGGSVTFSQAMLTGSTGTATASSGFSRGTSYYAYYGSTVKFKATATGNYIVAGWYSQESCASSSSIKAGTATSTTLEASVTGAKTAYAKFVTGQYTLSVEAWYKAASSITGPIATSATKDTGNTSYSAIIANGKYYLGHALTLTATAKAAYGLTGWWTSSAFSGNAAGSTIATSSQTLGGTINRYALFTMKSYKVTMQANRPSSNSNTPTWTLNGWTKAADSLSVSRTLYAVSGTVTLPAISITGLGFINWYTAASDGSVVTDVTNTSYTDKTYYAHWNAGFNVEARAETIAGLRSVSGAAKYEDLNSCDNTGIVGSAVSVKTLTGYTFAGWYTDANCSTAVTSTWVSGSGDSRKLTIPSGTAAQTTYYAKYTRTSYTERSIIPYILGTSGTTYTTGTKGTFTLKSTTANTNIISASTSSSKVTFTAYYGESFELSATSTTTNWLVYGFKVGTSTSTPTSADSAKNTTTASVTFSYSDISSTNSCVAILFRGKEFTIKFNANEKSGVKMPADVTAYFGTTSLSVTYGFNMYAVQYFENIGFDTTSTKTSSLLISRSSTSGYKSSATFTIDTTGLTIGSDNTVTLYAIWTQPNVWLTPKTSSGEYALDNLARGYSSLSAAVTALNGAGSSVTSGDIKVLKDATMSSTISITKAATITGHSSTTKIEVSSSGMFEIKAAFTISGITITGSSTATNGLFYIASGVTANIGASGSKTTISGMTSVVTIFNSDKASAKFNITDVDVVSNKVGSSSNSYAGIMTLTNGAKGVIIGSTFNSNTIVGTQMFYISGSTSVKCELEVRGTVIGSTANVINNASFEAVFYVNYGTLKFTKNGSKLPSIVVPDRRAVYVVGTSASVSGEVDVS